MNWNGHRWKAGKDGSVKPSASYYVIENADMPCCDAGRIATVAVEKERDRIVELWNATRHLDNSELDGLITMLKTTQGLTDKGISIGLFPQPHLKPPQG